MTTTEPPAGSTRPTTTRPTTTRSLAGRVSEDLLAIEEPLTIRLATLSGVTSDVAVTMRTPGNDDELAVGWLLAEGIIATRRDVVDVAPCALGADEDAVGNAIQVTLAAGELPDLSALDRHGLVTSACGVCGRRTLEALEDSGIRPVADQVRVAVEVVRSAGEVLRAGQPTFAATGGVHAAGAVTVQGELVDLREDVGRHNALDKLVGSALLDGRSLAEHVLVLSGRASYELLMKAAVARTEVVVAMGAASTLAVDVADRFGLTLVSFAAGPDPNLHTRPDRIASTQL